MVLGMTGVVENRAQALLHHQRDRLRVRGFDRAHPRSEACAPSSTHRRHARPAVPGRGAELRDAEDDLLAFTAFPSRTPTLIGSTNPLEWLNEEIKRRTDVVGWGHLPLARDFPIPRPCSASSARSWPRSTPNGQASDRRYRSEGAMALLNGAAPAEEVAQPALVASWSPHR